MLKLLITKYKKVTLYGDCHWMSETEMMFPFRGKAIKVKLFGLIWITYKVHEFEINT